MKMQNDAMELRDSKYLYISCACYKEAKSVYHKCNNWVSYSPQGNANLRFSLNRSRHTPDLFLHILKTKSIIFCGYRSD